MQYVRSLEQRVKQLEDDKRGLTHKVNQLATSMGDPSLAIPPEASNGTLSGRPEAVIRALQVLEVREQLEREGRMPERSDNVSDTASADMDDGEKALVREMCNVSTEIHICFKIYNYSSIITSSLNFILLKEKHRISPCLHLWCVKCSKMR